MINLKNILIVDDSHHLSQVIADFLGMQGYHVHVAHDGIEALRSMKEKKMDLVVSDIHMPNMDGFTLMSEIKSRYPKIPVILITGFSISEAKRMAFEKGAEAFLPKPVPLKELKAAIDSIFMSVE